MTRFFRCLLPILFLFTAAAHAEPAPEFSVADAEGRTISLADLRGKVVYLDFWASWCGPCRQSFPWMNQMHDAYGRKGLVVLAINVDRERDLANRFIEAMKPQFAIGFDPQGSIAERYKVQGMPSSYIIDRQGNIQARHIGFRESDTGDVENRILDLLESK